MDSAREISCSPDKQQNLRLIHLLQLLCSLCIFEKPFGRSSILNYQPPSLPLLPDAECGRAPVVLFWLLCMRHKSRMARFRHSWARILWPISQARSLSWLNPMSKIASFQNTASAVSKGCLSWESWQRTALRLFVRQTFGVALGDGSLFEFFLRRFVSPGKPSNECNCAP